MRLKIFVFVVVVAVGMLASCGGGVATGKQSAAAAGGCDIHDPSSCGPGFVCCPPGNPPDDWDGTGFCVEGSDPRICRFIQ